MSERGPSSDLERFLKAVPNWRQGENQGRWTRENLYEYLDGGAERYLGYGFQELVMREYVPERGTSRIVVEIYRMVSPANAYGIFSSDRFGENPGSVGRDACLGDQLLQFWQGPYFVRVWDADLVGKLRDTLLAFGRRISNAMPPSSAQDEPEIVSLLPATGRIESSLCYFHTHNSLNSLIYFGQENLLGIGPQVEAVTAEYLPVSSKIQVRVLLFRYPDNTSCAEGFDRIMHQRDSLPEDTRNRLSHVALRGKDLMLIFSSPDIQWSRWMEAQVWKGR